MGVPTHAIDILADAKQRGMAKLGKVNLFYMAGSTIPPQTARAFLDMGIKPQNIYGMTENGSHQYTMPDDDGRDHHHHLRPRLPRLRNAAVGSGKSGHRSAQAGDIGEIGTRGALLMLGYFNNQSATENSFNAGGWFMSGDLGRMDEHGNLQIVGRKKDLIIRGGHNIHPARIENLALKHPAVLKAAAFPVADRAPGRARVPCDHRARRHARSMPMQLLAHLNDAGLSKYDMPEFFIRMEAFPLTASGKILKRELVEWAKAGKITPAPVRWISAEKRSA